MKRYMPLAALSMVLLISGCSTLGFLAPAKPDGAEIAGLINAGDWESLSAKSGSPFLLDREMIMRQADMQEFWKILAEGGFRLGEAEVSILDEEATAARYGQGLEIEQFFAKYVPSGASTFLIQSEAGRFYLTVGRDSKRTNRIYAFAGPTG
ncbi:hypothetical protein [Marispirochaeta sp.]|uniref:hypothetical protein n=1 Tax=Marispirochaeta sp. TaxID=2038653 RepID=UPI0029C7CA8F|nr:hypothetical protein [Marispirochaeta sp.]